MYAHAMEEKSDQITLADYDPDNDPDISEIQIRTNHLGDCLLSVEM